MNMSQKDLAYSSDLDRSYIASVESGLDLLPKN